MTVFLASTSPVWDTRALLSLQEGSDTERRGGRGVEGGAPASPRLHQPPAPHRTPPRVERRAKASSPHASGKGC